MLFVAQPHWNCLDFFLLVLSVQLTAKNYALVKGVATAFNDIHFSVQRYWRTLSLPWPPELVYVLQLWRKQKSKGRSNFVDIINYFKRLPACFEDL